LFSPTNRIFSVQNIPFPGFQIGQAENITGRWKLPQLRVTVEITLQALDLGAPREHIVAVRYPDFSGYCCPPWAFPP
jgi:hypothetical protein